ncbi:MAG: TonB-dependent siderophore receptor [Nitrospira sp.]|nr:MAG: TonB-dependent siderophore receptor [Nitrospira sp.]
MKTLGSNHVVPHTYSCPRSVTRTGHILVTILCLTAFTACIGPIKPVPTQQSQEAPPPSTETAEPSKPAEPAPSEPSAAPSGILPLPLPPIGASQPIKPEERGEMPVVEAKPVMVIASRQSYNVTHSTTATRTNTPIMETPYSIQVVPQQILRDQQAVRLGTALQNVSGVSPFPSAIEGGDGYMIRGFESTAHYRNGVLRPTNNLVEAANIQQIEVLKGPASILYGRADPGGIINVVTKQPQETPAYSLQQQFGSYNFFRTTGDATGPLNQDKNVLYRFNFAYENSESFRDFVDRKTMFFAPVVQWKVSPRTQITAELEYQNINTKSDGLLPALGNRPAPVPVSRYLDEPSFSKSKNERFFTGLNWSHEFNDDWKVAHRISGEFIHGLGHREIVPFSAVNPDGTVDRFLVNTPRGTQENRYQSSLNLTGHVDTGALKHTLLFGHDYLYQTDKFVVSKCCDIGGPPFLPINVFNPVYGVGIPPLDQVPDNGPFGSSRSWHGFYLQDQVKLPFNLHALAGVRYDDAVSNDTVLNERTGKDHRLSPRVGLLWQPVSWLSLYGSYTENFGLQNVFDIRRQPLPPQTAQQFETGVKTEFFDGRLRTTVAYFDLTKQNVAVPDPTNPQFAKAIGEAQTRGIELDVSGEILPGWSVIASYTYMPFAKITKDFADDGLGGTTAGNTGNRLFNAAKDMGSLWSTYAFQDEELHSMKLRGLKVGAGLLAAGERQGDAANTFQLPGYVIANAMTSYEWHLGMTKMTAQLNVSNLFDRTYYAGTNGGNYFIQPGMPRFFMGSIRMEF